MRRTQLTDAGVNIRTIGLFVLLIALVMAVGGGSTVAATWLAVGGVAIVMIGASMRRNSATD